MTGILKGVSGSIRCLALHPEHMLIASVGLDRFLRVHHVGTLKPQASGARRVLIRAVSPGTRRHWHAWSPLQLKMYLKNQISAIAWGPVSATEAAQAEEEERRVREAEAAQKEAEKVTCGRLNARSELVTELGKRERHWPACRRRQVPSGGGRATKRAPGTKGTRRRRQSRCRCTSAVGSPSGARGGDFGAVVLAC